MSRVLVTGAGGFIGSHLTELLVSKGHQVRAFLHYNSDNRWGWLEDSKVKGEIEVLLGDIRDYDSVHAAIQGCETVFHLAALIGIPYSYISPAAYIKTNIEGTYNVLQASRALNVHRLLVTSTSETYGTAQYVPIDEAHPLVGQSPYSASKIGADQLAISYHRSFNLPVNIVRPFNTYGPRQSARAIIPTIISQALAGEPCIELGSTHPTRDLTFVTDTAASFLAVAKCDSLFGQVVNVGSGAEISIGDLITKISKIMGVNIDVRIDPARVRPQASEVERLLAETKLIRSSTNWAPTISLDDGLKHTIAWIKEHHGMYKSNIYNV